MSPGKNRSRPGTWDTAPDEELPLIPSYAPETRTGPEVAWDDADEWWRDCAARALKWMAESGQDFDAWDLVQLGVPDPDDHHRWGGLFRVAAQQGLIESVGYAPSRRPTAGGSIARVWRGVRQ